MDLSKFDRLNQAYNQYTLSLTAFVRAGKDQDALIRAIDEKHKQDKQVTAARIAELRKQAASSTLGKVFQRLTLEEAEELAETNFKITEKEISEIKAAVEDVAISATNYRAACRKFETALTEARAEVEKVKRDFSNRMDAGQLSNMAGRGTESLKTLVDKWAQVKAE